MRNVRVLFLLVAVLALTGACESSNGGGATDTGGPGPDVQVHDVGVEDVPVSVEDLFVLDVQVADLGAPDLGAPDLVSEDVPVDVGNPDTFTLPEFKEVGFPPRELAFAFTRPPLGEPIPTEEVTAFTRRVAATLKEVGYFRWLLRTSTGMDASSGMADYLAWHNDVRAVKEGDKVTFEQRGGEHNMWINSSKVLTAVMGAYHHTGDWEAAKLTEQYCKGLTATVKGFVWGEDDPAPWLMARAIFPMDHQFTMDEATWRDDGRRKRVEFSHAYTEARHWNAQTFGWPENPTWGSIWVTNMRSKDDVRAITRLVPFLPAVVEGARDEWVREACAETLDTMVHFHKDIVDEEYSIRTKNERGEAYRLPCDTEEYEENTDLGSYLCYVAADPRNECCSRLATDMIAYGERLTNDCGTCTGSLYDAVAPLGNIYNASIIWDYHMAAVAASLLHGQNDEAFQTLTGLVERIDGYVHPPAGDTVSQAATWASHVAHLLVEAAAVGLPLTAHEVRQVHSFWDQTAVELTAWPNWDLWDESVPDGTYEGWTNWDWWTSGQPPAEQSLRSYRPVTSTEAIPVQWFAALFEYCISPFQNPAGAAFVDCEILRDPSTWAAPDTAQ